ncbi:BTAD domain-containing putative transcriptional regulator [Euzebya tangerina]|uniref:BTAD domain-containing putative transcriptional regulator n=1 Tax=Euzebya tangerina TaxID=591198 RepID=UPI0013C318C6|nr:BTAD domain-containing putative transcriptional regulator [Euzebya tangerina]
MSSQLRIAVMGPLQVLDGQGEDRTPPPGNLRRLLLALIVGRGETLSADGLVDRVWHDAPPRHPIKALRTSVSRLRGLLEPEQVGGTARILTGGPSHYRLDLSGHELDAEAVAAAHQDAVRLMRTDPVAALRQVERIRPLLRGTPIPEVADLVWASAEAARLAELGSAVEELRLQALVHAGHAAEALPEVEWFARAHELRESAHLLLIQTLHTLGRLADASRAFHRYRELLAESSGLDPGGAIIAAHDRILRGEPPPQEGVARDAAALHPLPLPARRTRLVRASATVDEAARRLDDAAVVTLVGPGGVGKTCVALEVAHTHHQAQPWAFVELQQARSGRTVMAETYRALGLPPTAAVDGPDGLIARIQAEPLVLLVDNCEHVLDLAADLVDRLLARCPGLRVLATSREPLQVPGEHLVRVAPLEEEAAQQLFVARLAAIGVTVRDDPDTARLVGRICARLDGLPLALELAASRVDHMPLAQVADNLDRRFWLLAGQRRSVARQQTLLATLDWSFELLEGSDAALLLACGAFVGGFTAVALADVADVDESEVVQSLASLVRKSLVLRDGEVDGIGRYRLLETVAAYARRRCDDDVQRLRDRHADHHLRRVVGAGTAMTDMPWWGVSLGDQSTREDLIAALDHLVACGRLADVGRMAGRIPTVLRQGAFLDPNRRYLGRDDVSDRLDDHAERALYLTASGMNACVLADYGAGHRFAAAARAIAVDPVTRAVACAYAAQGLVVSRPGEVPPLVDEGLTVVPSSAVGVIALLHDQRCNAVTIAAPPDVGLRAWAAHPTPGHPYARSQQDILRWVVGEPPSSDQPTDLSEDPQWPLWRYLISGAAALEEATAGNLTQAWEHLNQAVRWAERSPLGLSREVAGDLLVIVAGLCCVSGDREAASEGLSLAWPRLRTPAVAQLARHLDRLTRSPATATALGDRGLTVDLDGVVGSR